MDGSSLSIIIPARLRRALRPSEVPRLGGAQQPGRGRVWVSLVAAWLLILGLRSRPG
jgi:hypothetical protein